MYSALYSGEDYQPPDHTSLTGIHNRQLLEFSFNSVVGNTNIHDTKLRMLHCKLDGVTRVPIHVKAETQINKKH